MTDTREAVRIIEAGAAPKKPAPAKPALVRDMPLAPLERCSGAMLRAIATIETAIRVERHKEFWVAPNLERINCKTVTALMQMKLVRIDYSKRGHRFAKLTDRGQWYADSIEPWIFQRSVITTGL